jgi:hypothetical protein
MLQVLYCFFCILSYFQVVVDPDSKSSVVWFLTIGTTMSCCGSSSFTGVLVLVAFMDFVGEVKVAVVTTAAAVVAVDVDVAVVDGNR